MLSRDVSESDGVGNGYSYPNQDRRDANSRNRIVLAYLPLVAKVASAYRSPFLTRDDLINSGILGLITAVDQRMPSAESPFSTYAVHRIREAIQQAVISANRFIRIPRHLRRRIAKWRAAARTLELEFGRPPGREEITCVLGKYSAAAMGIQRAVTLSYVAFLSEEALESIPQEASIDSQGRIDGRLGNAEYRDKVLSCMKNLRYLERRVLELRFGLCGEKCEENSLKKTSLILGCSRSQVRRLERKAISRMRSLVGNEFS